MGKGEAHRLLVAIHAQIVRTLPRAVCVSSLDAFGIWRAPSSGIIASSRVLDLDDFCPVPPSAATHCLSNLGGGPYWALQCVPKVSQDLRTVRLITIQREFFLSYVAIAYTC
jgi:hypothetical protein